VEHGALLGRVDTVAAEHRLDLLAQPARVGQSDEKTDRLIRDAVLRVIEGQAGGLHGEALAARRVVGEQRSQVHVAHLLVMRHKRPPRRERGQRWRL